MEEKNDLKNDLDPEKLLGFFPVLLKNPFTQYSVTSFLNVFSLLKPEVIFLNENEPLQDELLPADHKKLVLVLTFHSKTIEKLEEFDPEYKIIMRVNELAKEYYTKESDTMKLYQSKIDHGVISKEQYEEKIIKEGLSNHPLISAMVELFIKVLQNNMDDLLKLNAFCEQINKSTIVKRAIDAYTESLISNKKLNIFSNVLFMEQYFEATKRTSDKVAHEIIEILKQWLKRKGINYASAVVVSRDGRIPQFMDADRIREYFMKLTIRNGKNGKCILTPAQVEQLLHANFQGFEPAYKKKKLQHNFRTLKDIIKFFYDLSLMDSHTKLRNKVYTDLILENFKVESKSKDPRKYILKHFKPS